MKKKALVQALLCVGAVVNMWLFDLDLPHVTSTVGDVGGMIFCAAWSLKRFLCIPLTYGFVLLAIQLLWREDETE